MPVAALLASTRPGDGSPPPRVVVVQRNSVTSGWKVDAINSGRSPLGASEPELDRMVAEAVASGRLESTHDVSACRDADAIIVCVPTDRSGLAPDHAPLIDALTSIATALRERPVARRPLVVIESTLAPSSLASVVAPLFRSHGLVDGDDILLAYSPSRVMPGDLTTQVARADKLVGGLHPEAPVEVAALYRRILTSGRAIATNALTAEMAKTVENGFRDVRHAFSAEVARYCDRNQVDFLTLRDEVNDLLGTRDHASWDPFAPSRGALPVATLGVGGHCLPKDGILLWWRALEAGFPSRNSLVLAARAVNDASPAAVVRMARMELGQLNERRVVVLGASYAGDCGDARNAPGLVLASLLRDRGADVVVHDPFVDASDPGLERFGLASQFHGEVGAALAGRSVVFLATAHRAYRDLLPVLRDSSGIDGVIDGANLFQAADFAGSTARYAGIGRGRRTPDSRFIHAVATMYRAVSRGVANEVVALAGFLNGRYASDMFNRVQPADVLRLASGGPAAAPIEEPGEIEAIEPYEGFVSGLAQLAVDSAPERQRLSRVKPEHVPPGLWFGNEDALVPDVETPWPLTPAQ